MGLVAELGGGPVAPVLLSAERQLGELPAAAAAALEYAESIETGARRGADLVRQHLTLARVAEGERIELAPAALLDELAKIARSTFPRAPVAVRRERAAAAGCACGCATATPGSPP